MTLIKRLGPDTISRLERAAPRRFSEAEWLHEGKYSLAAIYFYGYTIEIVLGAAYFRVLGSGRTEPISINRLGRVLHAARLLSRFEDKSHPVDGLSRLLVQDKQALSPPAYSKKMERAILDHADSLLATWGPKLRYRAIDVMPDEVTSVRKAAEWFVKNSTAL